MSPTFDWRDLSTTVYEARANQHRPSDVEQLRREVQRLHQHQQGLTPRDIGQALGIAAEAVLHVMLTGGVETQQQNSERC
jgi:hypothetical protein